MRLNEKSAGLVWGLLHVILTALFLVVIYVWIDSFGGEFLIVAERTWILIGFGVILTLGAVTNFFPRPLATPPFLRLGVAAWNICAGVLLLLGYRYLIVWVVDMLGGIELMALSLPFIGYGMLLIGDGLRVLVRFLRQGVVLSLSRGMIMAGLAFLFLFAGFAVTLLFWNPHWAGGVDHKALFAPGMQVGRGYRIPSLLVIRDQNAREIVVAFAESRADVMLDWGDIDLVMRRSFDGGRSWTPIRTLVDAGKHTAGNPCPVFDQETHTLWLPYCIDNKRVFLIHSRDYGMNWSAPLEITGQLDLHLTCNDSPLCLEYGTGPGIGIQLSSGRLIIPAYFFGPSRKRGAHIIYSDDHGVTWHKGSDLGAGEEPQAFETVEGKVCMNCRAKRGTYRHIGLSRDGGLTWYRSFAQPDLPEAETQASILRYTTSITYEKNRVLFSNPNFGARGHLTLRMSYDEGRSWPVHREIYSGPSGYSQLAVLADATILMLCETGTYDYREALTLVRLDSAWITNGKDRPLIKDLRGLVPARSGVRSWVLQN